MPSAAKPRVSRYAIRKLAKEIAARFEPQCIFLFGSQATGTADAESDVDLLVVMETRSQIGQAIAIREAIDVDFPLDLIVRTPKVMRRRLKAGDWFLREIIEQDQVLHGCFDAGMGAEGRGRLDVRPGARQAQAAAH